MNCDYEQHERCGCLSIANFSAPQARFGIKSESKVQPVSRTGLRICRVNSIGGKPLKAIAPSCHHLTIDVTIQPA